MTVPVKHERREPDVVTWGPAAELEQATERLARLVEQALGPGWSTPWADGSPFSPPADLEENDDAYVIDVELPGVAKGDVDVEVSGRRVTVSGERKERERRGVWRRRTRTTGRFRYEVTVPGDIDTDAVTAQLSDGVLTVTAPKDASERARRHKVRVT